MGWLVCAYFTKGNYYEETVVDLIESLNQFQIPFDITPIDGGIDWDQATQFKPTFLLSMLEKHLQHNVVYVDVDAIFCQYPELFNTIDKHGSENIYVHMLDHTQFRRKNAGLEMLSGTIFLRNTKETHTIVKAWIKECAGNKKLWDQRALANVLKNKSYGTLPAEYVCIFDYMSSVKNPVIKHFQASRKTRHNRPTGLVKKQIRTVQGGVIKISRANK